MCSNEIISAIKDITICIATLVASGTAIWGLTSWKKELHGKTQYETARSLLRSIYKLREAIAIVRAPFISTNEFYTALEEKGKKPEKLHDLIGKEGTWAVYSVRWKHVSDAMVEFRTQFFEAEVMWGREMKAKLIPLFHQVNQLNFWLQEYLKEESNPQRAKYDEKRDKIMKDFIYDTDIGSEDPEGEFSKKLINIISEIEDFIRPRMQK